MVRRLPVAAVEEIPEPSAGIDPEAGVVATGAVGVGQADRFWNRERPAAVVTPGKHDGVAGRGLLRPAGEPRDVEAPLRRPLEAGDALPELPRGIEFRGRGSLGGLRCTAADVLEPAEHDAVGGAFMVALRDGKPDRAPVLVERRILERMRRLKAVFPLPRKTVTGNVDVEDAAAAIPDLGVLLPAKVVDAAKPVERGLRVQAVGHEGPRLADGPRLAILAGREVVVALVVAADRHPGAVWQAVHRRLAELLRLRLVVVADDLEGFEVVEQHREGVLFALEVIDRDVAAAVALLERIEDVEAAIDRGLHESLGRGVGVEVPRLHVEHAGGRLQLRLVDAAREGLRA